MNVKTIIKLILPPIIVKFGKFIFRGFKHNVTASNSTIDLCPRVSELYILGNGPSLQDSLTNYSDFLRKKNLMVVNHFCFTEWYEKLRPSYYFWADPNLFADMNSLSEPLQERNKKFVKEFTEKTTWPVSFIVPTIAANSEIISQIKRNENIQIYFYDSTINNSYKSKIEKYQLWDKNLLIPPAQTVINACLWFSIYSRCSSVYLLGADTNWLEQLRVDQDTNLLYTVDKHFYGENKRKIVYSDVAGKIPQKMHEQLECQITLFKDYFELSEYAKWANVSVYNASEYSLIDVFERKRLDQIVEAD